MPELPEVESVRRGLQHWITGTRVTEARVLDPRILGTTSQRRIPPEAVDAFAEAVAGISLRAPQRRGKFLWVPFDRPCGSGAQPQSPSSALALHLGMSGQLRVHAAHEELHRHTRAVLTLEPGHASGSPSAPPAARGEGRLELRFLDQRIFGHIGVDDLVPDGPDSVPRRSSHIARDPLDPHWNAEATARVVQRSRAALKSVLMDQTVVSGVGNIYADEALHRAGVHPQAVPSRLRVSRIRRVLDESRIVMLEALAQGGTSFDALYVHVNGDSGYFARDLNVYGRSGLPCRRCGTPIVREKFTNRSSHFCPSCQRKR